MLKKIVATCSLMAPLLLLSAAPVFSLLQAFDSCLNLLSVGQNNIQVVEQFDPKPDENGFVKKQVKIKNTNDVLVYVRVLIKANDQSMIKKWDYLGTGWEQKQDGYWYYTEPLGYGEETEVLLNGFEVASKAKDIQVYVYSESAEAYGADSAEAAFAAYAQTGEFS